MIKKSLLIGSLTSLYFIPEIHTNSQNLLIYFSAYITQLLHDAVCV
jgi:hypothetical protein